VEQKQGLEEALNEAKGVIKRLEAGLSIRRPNSVAIAVDIQLREEREKASKGVSDLKAEIAGQKSQIAVLTQALSIKADDLGLEGDLRSSLLYDIGQCRTELSDALHREKSLNDTIFTLKDQLRTAQLNIEELKLIREANNDELNALERTLGKMKEEKVGLAERNRELAEERLSLLDYIDELKGSVREREETVERAEAALGELQRRNQSIGADFENKRMEREMRLEEVQLKYQQALDTLQELDRETALLRRQLADAQRGEDTANQQVAALEAEVEEGRILLETCQSSLAALQDSYSHLTQAKDVAENKAFELERRHRDLPKPAEDSKSRPSPAEQQLKERLEKALLDIEELVDERDQLREAMNDAINKCAAVMMAQQGLTSEMEKREKQVDTLIASKALLQKTMSDQVNTLKVQLDSLRRENSQLKASKS
jgi:chromosome segregation ATPase